MGRAGQGFEMLINACKVLVWKPWGRGCVRSTTNLRESKDVSIIRKYGVRL
jgi:hypothetical protein